MSKLFLLVLAGTALAASPGHAQAQSTQQPAPAQAQPSEAQPAQAAPSTPAQGTPAPAMAPVQAITTAPVTYPKNPVRPTAESLAKAKNLYAIDCSMCHGDNGNGKSDLATSMELTLTDWTDPKSLAGHQDGELFLIIRKGRDKMPPEESGRASDDAVWNLVFYIRGFSKGQASSASK
jgi:mono/diheme cytochrome c family protein